MNLVHIFEDIHTLRIITASAQNDTYNTVKKGFIESSFELQMLKDFSSKIMSIPYKEGGMRDWVCDINS